MSWLSSPYAPWNWPSDISHSFMNELESGIEYLFHLFLSSILSIFAGILSVFESLFSTFIMDAVSSVEILGPFGFPLFITVFIVIVGISMDLFHFAHDLPIVGDFI